MIGTSVQNCGLHGLLLDKYKCIKCDEPFTWKTEKRTFKQFMGKYEDADTRLLSDYFWSDDATCAQRSWLSFDCTTVIVYTSSILWPCCWWSNSIPIGKRCSCLRGLDNRSGFYAAQILQIKIPTDYIYHMYSKTTPCFSPSDILSGHTVVNDSHRTSCRQPHSSNSILIDYQWNFHQLAYHTVHQSYSSCPRFL